MKARIVVVEDEKLVALAIEKSLKDMGYDVPLTTSVGEEAVRCVAEIEPDLVLMDIRLKGSLDGIEAAQRIRSNFHIPVIFLTAYADEPTLERAKISEPFGYILKPFEEKSLQAAVEMTLYKSRMQSQLQRTKEKLETILGCVAEGVIVAGINGGVEYLNPSAQQILLDGRPLPAETTLPQIFTLLEQGTRKPFVLPVSTVIMDKKKVRLTGLLLRGKEGAVIPVDCSLAPLRDDNDITWGIVIVFADTSASRPAAKVP
jgi:two-component system, cell cycle sensor histidine kinase and response regulator CckA